MRHPSVPICALALVAALGCADRPRFDLRLVHSPTLSPATAFEEMRVRVRAIDGDGVVIDTTVRPADAMGGDSLADFSSLEVGLPYLVEVVAAAPRTCRLGRAVGRSLPFVHRAGDYQVPIHVGCADELFGLAPMRAPRSSHGIVAMPDGSAVIAGGARQIVARMGGMSFAEAVRPVERYDVTEARFTEVGLLAVPRMLPGATRTSLGDAAWVGGTTLGGAPICTSSVELTVGGSTSPGATLSHERCGAGVASLRAADVALVVGSHASTADRTRDIELLSGDLRETVAQGIEDVAYRYRPTVIALADGRSALVVAGRRAPEAARPVRVEVSDACDPACVTPVEHNGIPDSWADTDGVRVSCADGGSAVYLVGGSVVRATASPGSDDGVYCAVDRPSGLGTLRRVGTLPAPRRLARTVTIRGPGGAPRLLVVGGVEAAFEEARDAFLLDVTCDCALIDAADIAPVPTPMSGVLIQHAVAVLADGAVLVVGGMVARQPDPETVSFMSTGEAALFVPDLE